MHKSVIILSILFFGFDLGAVKHAQNSEARRLAALGIDYDIFPFEKKKRRSSESLGSVTELALLKRCKQLKRENDVLRSKLAVSPEELSKGGEASNPDRLSLDSGASSSSGTSPMIVKASLLHATSPITINRLIPKGKEERPYELKSSNLLICDSPCGFWIASSGTASSFPNDRPFLLHSLHNKNISPLAPYCNDCP